jgi:hypothetical protein
MWLTHFRWPILLAALASLTACVTNSSPPQQRVIIVKPAVIFTPVPAPREVVLVPSGSVRCQIVPGRWIYSTWVPQHEVCYYTRNPHKVMWVQGYWACTKYSTTGQCRNWKWHSAHWHKNTAVVY